jgi:hypothetical protein
LCVTSSQKSTKTSAWMDRTREKHLFRGLAQ